MTEADKNPKRTTRDSSDDAPRRSATWFLNGFHGFLKPYLKRHFHSIGIDRVSRPEEPFAADASIIVYANHPSWWDPLIAHFLHRSLFPGLHFFAPIDAEALEQYRVFEKLGFYGVRLSTTSGAAAFLKKSVSILRQPDSAIWITPEGRFADVRDHDTELMPGLPHLCKKVGHSVVIPLALEYVFWDDRLPVCLVSLGRPHQTDAHPEWSKSEWRENLNEELRSAQSRLADLAIGRSCEPFDNLLSGARGGGWFYDSCRRIKAAITGQSFKAHHGDQFQ